MCRHLRITFAALSKLYSVLRITLKKCTKKEKKRKNNSQNDFDDYQIS